MPMGSSAGSSDDPTPNRRRRRSLQRRRRQRPRPQSSGGDTARVGRRARVLGIHSRGGRSSDPHAARLGRGAQLHRQPRQRLSRPDARPTGSTRCSPVVRTLQRTTAKTHRRIDRSSSRPLLNALSSNVRRAPLPLCTTTR
jgi:hypothetical protein